MMRLRTLILNVLAFTLLPFAMAAQNPSPLPAPTPAPAASDVINLYAAGVSYNPGNGKQSIAGNAIYAHQLTTTDPNTGQVSSNGTYLFADLDIVPISTKPFLVSNNVGTGVAQRVFTIGKVPIWVPTAVGISWTGANVGYQWNTGAAATIKLKDGLFLIPHVRVIKSSVNNNDGYKPIIGFDVGFGK